MFEKKSRRIPLDSLQFQTLSGRKRSNLTGKVGTKIFHGVLPGTVHQDKTFEFKLGEIGYGAFKSIFTGMPQVKPADDGANSDVRTGSPAGFDRIDDSGMAASRNQHAGDQQERLFLRDEIRHCACTRKRKVFRFTRRTCRTCRLGQVRQIDGWGEDLRCDYAVALFRARGLF